MFGAGMSELAKTVAVSSRLRLLRAGRVLSRLTHSARGVQGFFDLYPRFYSTSVTGATPNRLNQRHRALIESNEAIIRGQSVLDIASHDGRWSFAAHKAGARHVLGVEAREHLVKVAEANMREYRVPEHEFRFILGDVFEEIDQLEPNTIDTVFCFGFFYHTMHHMLLLSQIARLRPRHLILDTEIALDPGNVVRVRAEGIADEGYAARSAPGSLMHCLVGVPSKTALELMLSSSGWNYAYYDWHKHGVKRWDNLVDYHEGRRVSLAASAKGEWASGLGGHRT